MKALTWAAFIITFSLPGIQGTCDIQRMTMDADGTIRIYEGRCW